MLQTVGTSNFLYFFLFEGLKEPLAQLAQRPEGVVGPYETLASSAIAGALNMCITEPLWKACVVSQALPASGKTLGVLGTVCHMWAAEGPRALWRGLSTSLWLVSNPVIQFFVYDWLKALRLDSDITALQAFSLGAFAKALATLLTFPMQVAQSRLRLAGRGGSAGPDLAGMIPCLRAVFHEKGFAGLYVGLLPKLVSTVTQAAFMFAFYEKVHAAIRRMSRQGLRLARRTKFAIR